MAKFLLLPESRTVLNLDCVETAWIDAEGSTGTEATLSLAMTGMEDAQILEGQDAMVVLRALANELGLTSEDLAARLKEDTDPADPFRLD